MDSRTKTAPSIAGTGVRKTEFPRQMLRQLSGLLCLNCFIGFFSPISYNRRTQLYSTHAPSPTMKACPKCKKATKIIFWTPDAAADNIMGSVVFNVSFLKYTLNTFNCMQRCQNKNCPKFFLPTLYSYNLRFNFVKIYIYILILCFHLSVQYYEALHENRAGDDETKNRPHRRAVFADILYQEYKSKPCLFLLKLSFNRQTFFGEENRQ